MTAALLLWCAVAVAQDDREPWGPDADDTPPVEVEGPVTEKREAPDYDSRDVPPPAEKLLWVPRTVLSPVYAVDRYLLYPPIRAVAIWAEKNHIPVRVVNSFTVFDDDYRLRIYPTTLIDFGFRPSVGLLAGLKGKNAPYSVGSIQAAYGGNGWVAFNLRESLALTADGREGDSLLSGSDVNLSVKYIDRPDHVFFGLGSATQAQRTRFSRKQIAGEIRVHGTLPAWLAGDLSVGVDQNSFGRGRSVVFDEPSIESRFDIREIPGFNGYTLLYGDIAASLDTRDGRPAQGSGARLDLAHRMGFDLEGPYDMTRSTGEISAFVDLSGRNHTIGLSQFAGVAGSSGVDVPFTEQLVLGGNEHLRGFLDGRFRGNAALSSALQYNWPIWVFTDATIFAEVGGVYDDFGSVDIGEMSSAFGTGLRTNGERETSFQALVAVGTTQFGGDIQIDTVRLVVGTNRGF